MSQEEEADVSRLNDPLIANNNNVASFCQPPRLITCAKQWQEQVLLFAHCHQ